MLGAALAALFLTLAWPMTAIGTSPATPEADRAVRAAVQSGPTRVLVEPLSNGGHTRPAVGKTLDVAW